MDETTAASSKAPPQLETTAVADHRQQVIAESSCLAAALAASRPDPWGPGYLRLYLICSLIFLVATMLGNVMGSINALPEYTAYYHLPVTGNAGTGIVFSIFQVFGQMAAAVFFWFVDWQGRRLSIFVGCLGACIGAIVTAVAPSLTAFIGGRFLLSFFAAIATQGASLYLVEIAPPQYRGTLTGLFSTLYFLGSIIATTVVYGANLHLAGRGNLSWRLPLWLQMVCPALACLGIWFCPESPRWLVGKGWHTDARKTLTKLHANGMPDSPLVNLQLAEMSESLERDGMVGWRTIFNLGALFRTRARLYRTGIGLAFAWFAQFSGNNVASYYLPILLQNVGIVDTSTKLLLNVAYAITGWIPAIAGARCTVGMAVCLAIAAGTAARYEMTGSKAASGASIAFIFVFGCVFAFGFTPMQPIYPSEVLSNDMRAKGGLVFGLASGCAGFVNTLAAPVALEKVNERNRRSAPMLMMVHFRLVTGSMCSSSDGISSNFVSFISSLWRPRDGLWKRWTPYSKQIIHGKLACES
ncbi:hypothetical protein M409DRAFT_65076 [Zasmidium cellare ATCC 36951]|uniref:Major facilitator superfamily (MFS) profile domain-containing protein n=1 Tax=Zasmidium cellare ATCC 36951 TaxID=1080233 RepID=A0A6A6CUC8_ZASCE|nr:uncharacterized protein M409DRAFT_65076 [Zasmidium cellare ATCC 36951]KAF2169399.1 hypothetical protein M409DRAFT_65076 [Zasmidium cellare ATCC 36951]